MIELVTTTGLGSTLMLGTGIAAILWITLKGKRR